MKQEGEASASPSCGWVIAFSSVSHRLLLAPHTDISHQPLHIFRFVIKFTLNLGERQPSGITKGLQGTGRNVKAQADILTVQSLTKPFIRIFLIQPVHACR
jgi:hypothetical protein